jgi:hypothetical protein
LENKKAADFPDGSAVEAPLRVLDCFVLHIGLIVNVGIEREGDAVLSSL